MANSPLRLALIATLDAKGVSAGAGEVRREVEGVGRAAADAAGGLTRLSAANDAAAAAEGRATAALQGRAAAERTLREAIDARLGIGARGARSVAETGADLEAYGRKLDALRARYNPLYAEIARYRTALSEIRQAHAVGAIGADEMVAAIGRERKAALEAVAAIKGLNAARTAAGDATRFHSTNLMFQAQDIAITSAMGMSPAMIALSQGAQIGGIVQQMGGGAAAAGALRAALLALVSPANLAAIAITGVTAAAIQYFMSGKDAIQTLDDALEMHRDAIGKVAAAYGEMGNAADHFGERSVAQLEAAERRARALLEVTAEVEQQALAKSLSQGSGWTLFGMWNDLVNPAELQAVNLQFAAFAEPIKQLRQEIAAGKPDFDAFQKAIEGIAATDPGRLRKTADEILGLSDASADASRFLDQTAAGLRDLSSINPNTVRAQQQIQAVADVAERTVLRLRDLYVAGSAIQNMLQGMDALARGVAPKGDAVGGSGSLDRAQEQFDAMFALWRRFGYDDESGIDPNKPKKTKGSSADPWRDLVKNARDQIEAMRAVAATIGMAGIEADAYRFRLDLLQQATDKGRKLDEEKRVEIERLTAAYREAATEVAALTAVENLRFEREQMFRSRSEQRVFAELKNLGLDIASEQGQLVASQIRLNEQLAYSRELAGDFVSTFVNGIMQGKSVMEALGDAALSVLSKIADKLLNEVLDAVFKVMAAGSGGGGGGNWLSGLFGGLFGGIFGGGGFTNFEYAWTAANPGLWAKGGIFDPSGAVPFARGAAFTNSIVSRPTLFPFANGTGLMGEAGPEAIMPLTRGASGRLGVDVHGFRPANQNGAAGGTTTVRLVMPDGWRTEIVAEAREGAREDTVRIVTEYDGARENRWQNGAPR